MDSPDSPPLDLTTCDREPIHIPGSIQPHGILLAVDPETLGVLQVAGDTDRLLGREAARILAGSLEDTLGEGAAALVRESAATHLPEPLFVGSLAPPAAAGQALDVTAHARDGILILEIEPAAPSPGTAAEMLAKVRRAGAEMEAAPDLPRLLQAASREVRRLTGFDRVLVYRFLEDGSGAVEAEDKIETLDRLLNHRYPASDIPRQARALYLQNTIRVIPDAGYTPAPLAPVLNPLTGRPLDMSDCALRSVSPVHVKYLRNMGITASMSVSIIVDGALWGLVSCHHMAPKLVSYEQREACKHLGQILGQQVKARQEAALHRQTLRLASVREDFLATLARADALGETLLDQPDSVRSLVPADGAAVLLGDTIRRSGHAPTDAQIRDLAEWLLRTSPSTPFATDSLPRAYPRAKPYATEASGLLAIVVSREEPLLVLWFRAEQPETINWAGNPHKPVEPGSDPKALSPRKSFELWKETVRHRSRPWSIAEIEGARKIGQSILELRQQHALRELNRQLRQTLSDKDVLLAQKDLLMQEVNHRVQNSLQLVNSMLHIQPRQIADPEVRRHFDEASRRILAVSSVHRRLWRSDHIRSVDLGSYLEELRDGLLATWGRAWADHIQVHAGHVLIPTDQAVIIALVVTELLTNAVKYAYGGQPGPIDVTVREEVPRSLRVTVRDEGVGAPAEVPGSGLGSRLTRSLVKQLGGELEVGSLPSGTCVSFVVPLAALPAHR